MLSFFLVHRVSTPIRDPCVNSWCPSDAWVVPVHAPFSLSNTFDGKRYQFKDVSCSLARGAKVGLVGVNGCGKSTLLRAIAGLEKCESGDIETKSGLRVVYVEQEPVFPSGMTVRDVMYLDNPALAAVRSYEEASERLASGSDEAYQAFQKASAQMDAVGGWELETLANQIFQTMNVKHLETRRVETLSGGERKRLGLATALLRRPDVMLLDEPSNHMDIEAIELLEGMLQQRDQTFIVVTHDRYFLEKVCSGEIWELENGNLWRYTGNYEKYLEAKALRLAGEEGERASDLKKLKRELEWMRKQPRARMAKSKARQEAYYSLVKKTTKKEEVKKLSLESASSRLGSFIMAFDSATLEFKAANKAIIRDFTYEFGKGDRVGIVGPNGVGKSTFLSVLLGQQPLDSGEVMRGQTVRFGYYSQTGMKFPENQRVFDFVKDTAEEALALAGAAGDAAGEVSGEALARQLLQRFQFPISRWMDVVAKLSGGERRRLQILWVLAQRANMLVLDEPTNDLDLMTLAALEEYLTEDYKGVLVVVSHDRRFMDKVVDHCFVFEGEGVVNDFQGSFTELMEFQRDMKQQKQQEQQQKTVSSRQAGTPARRRGLTNKEKREMQQLEKQVDSMTKQRKEFESQLENGHKLGAGYSELAAWSQRLEELSRDIITAEERWMELMEMADA